MKHVKLCSALIFAGLIPVSLPNPAQAQRMDFAVGVNAMTAPPASDAEGHHAPVSLTGGVYPSFSMGFVMFKNFGFQGEFAWRGGRADYLHIQPYRPFFYDFNALYQPRIAKRTYFELLGGIGGMSTRFYTPFQVCDTFTCQNFVTVNHFMGHFGAGIKAYPSKKINLFVRPESHLYLVHDNQEFSSGRAVRFGISLGYTFGER